MYCFYHSELSRACEHDFEQNFLNDQFPNFQKIFLIIATKTKSYKKIAKFIVFTLLRYILTKSNFCFHKNFKKQKKKL